MEETMQYYLRLDNGKDFGPLTEAAVFGCLRMGKVNYDNFLWDGNKWVPLQDTFFAHQIPTVKLPKSMPLNSVYPPLKRSYRNTAK